MKYNLLYIDVPREYANRHETRKDNPSKKTKFGIGVAERYQLGVMNNNKLELLPLLEVAEDNCALFSWATCPNLPDDIALLKAWGFRFVTVAFVWVKLYKSGQVFFGTGSYSASNVELCFLAMRGKLPRHPLSCSQVLPIEETDPPTLLRDLDSETITVMAPHPRLANGKIKHSAKPPIVRDLIKGIFGDLPALEIFATTREYGWDSVGVEVDGMDVFDSLPQISSSNYSRQPRIASRGGRWVFS